MNSKTLTQKANKLIDGYEHFHIGNAITSVPYFNNKTIGAKFGERTRVGKGSPADIQDELEVILVKNHIVTHTLTSESLKKILVDHNLGIDCSAFVYHVLDAECKERGQGHLNRRMIFKSGKNPVTKMWAYLRPVQNCNVKTFASNNNSRVIAINDVKPGDFVSMIRETDANERNHILLIHEVIYENDQPKIIHYTHAIAYSEEGPYGSGIKQGKISIMYPGESLTKQIWTESNKPEMAAEIFDRAQNSITELRRLKWFS